MGSRNLQVISEFRYLDQDFNTDSGTPVDIPGLAFTPLKSRVYIVEGMFLLRTSNMSYGVRMGSVQPSGLEDGAIAYGVATSAGGSSLYHVGAIASEWFQAATALPDAVNSWPAWIKALLVVGASPSGNFQMRVRSETGGITVTVRAGSYIKVSELGLEYENS